MKKIILAVSIAALAAGIYSCSENNGGSSAKADANGLKTFEDSLAYYIGTSQGGMFLQNYNMASEEEKAQFNKKEYLKGFEQMIKLDSTQNSYMQGAQFGMQVAGQLNYWEQNGIYVDRKALYKAFKDALMADTVDNREIQQSVGIFQMLMQDAQTKVMQNRNAAQAEENKIKGAEFVKEAIAKDNTIKTTNSGLAYKVIAQGQGPNVTDNDSVKVHYTGKLIDGRTFDSSQDGEPATFTTNGVIPGFREALKMMNKGAKYEVYIPSDLAYGDNGVQMIPPGATLVFTLEVVDIVPQNQNTQAKPAEQK